MSLTVSFVAVHLAFGALIWGCGLGWAGFGIGLGSPHTSLLNVELDANAIQNETHTTSIYPVLEGLGFQDLGPVGCYGVRVSEY